MKDENMREAFENVMYTSSNKPARRNGVYESASVRHDWLVWRVAYNAALHAAARECDKRAIGPTTAGEWGIAIDCAREIRAMMDETADGWLRPINPRDEG